MPKQSKTSSKSVSSQVSTDASSASETPAAASSLKALRPVTAEELALVQKHSQNAVTLSVRPRPASLRSRPAAPNPKKTN